MVNVTLLNFVLGELTIRVKIEFLEDTSELFSFLLADKLTTNKCKGGGFHGLMRMEMD